MLSEIKPLALAFEDPMLVKEPADSERTALLVSQVSTMVENGGSGTRLLGTKQQPIFIYCGTLGKFSLASLGLSFLSWKMSLLGIR